MSAIIARNNTDENLPLFGLGVIVPASGQATLTDLASTSEISLDRSLAEAIVSTRIIINNGEQDLSPEAALIFIQARLR